MTIELGKPTLEELKAFYERNERQLRDFRKMCFGLGLGAFFIIPLLTGMGELSKVTATRLVLIVGGLLWFLYYRKQKSFRETYGRYRLYVISNPGDLTSSEIQSKILEFEDAVDRVMRRS